MPMPPPLRDKWPQKRVSARQQMLKLRQFDLELAFLLRARAPGENVKDERSAVQHLAIKDVFQIAGFGPRKARRRK